MSGNGDALRPKVWSARFNRCWLLGMFVQHSLLRKEGISVPSPEQMMKSNPSIDIVEAINLQRQMYGAEVDWENQTIIVRYKSKKYDITKKIIEIVNVCTFGNMIDELSIDTKGFDFKNATFYANENIIAKIVDGTLAPDE
ncbi:MAG: hypothetical protein WED07_04600 [Candidatus Freyarchaeum deiterrae]